MFCIQHHLLHLLSTVIKLIICTQGSSDLSVLTEVGEEQAERCKKALENIYFDQCFASPISRAKVSASKIFMLLANTAHHFIKMVWVVPCSKLLKLYGKAGKNHWFILILSERYLYITLKA